MKSSTILKTEAVKLISEKYNGGITLKIGNYSLKRISSYSPSWEQVTEQFTAYDYSTVSIYKGSRFKLNVTSGYLTPDELSQLRSALLTHNFVLTCPDFSGAVILESCSAPLEHANIYGKFYTVSFAVSAVNLTGGSGSL